MRPDERARFQPCIRAELFWRGGRRRASDIRSRKPLRMSHPAMILYGDGGVRPNSAVQELGADASVPIVPAAYSAYARRDLVLKGERNEPDANSREGLGSTPHCVRRYWRSGRL